MKARIKWAVEALGLQDNVEFTIKELETIAGMADAPLFEVMKYLRFGR